MQLRNLADSLPDSFLYQFTLEGETPKFVYISAGVERVNGIKAELAMQDAMVLMGQIDPVQRQAYAAARAASQRDLSDLSMDLHMLTAAGEWRWVQVKSHPRRGRDGQVVWDGIATDITDRRLLETEINRLAQAIEQSPIAVLITDTNGTLEFMNEASTRISGYQFADIYARSTSLREIISTELSDAEYGALQARLLTGNTWSGVLRNRHKNGKMYWQQLTVSPIYDNDGKVASYLFLRTDVTEQKRSEEALLRLNRELRAISNCNQVLVRAEDEQTLLDDICRIVCDEAGYRMAWVGYAENDEARTIRVVARAGVDDGHIEQAGITWADTERGRGPSGTAIRSGMSACIQDFSTDPQAAPWRESALRRGYRSSIAMPLKDEGAKTFGILTIYSTEPDTFTADETRLLEELASDLAFGIVVLRARIEHKQAEEEIRKLNQELETRVVERTAQLEAANKELEAFSYSVSHDLRAPLRHIDGFLGLLRQKIEPTLDDESRRYVATISDAALRMARLIDDLLSFSRSGRFEMNKSQVDLGALVREVIGEFEPEAQGRVVDWCIAELPVVNGDRAMLRVVLVNLISNALKFTQPRARAEIGIGCQADEAGETIVFVRDNGVGFDMKYVGKLFSVFERLHGADEFEGTGIGLANVRRVINRHGGRTWAEGKVDGGATFYFSLPHERTGY